MPPTVFTDVADDAEICKSEIFGPVAVVHRFSTEQEIVRRANNSEFGLMSGVFTRDINRAMRVAAELEAGMVGINCISKVFITPLLGGANKAVSEGRTPLMLCDPSPSQRPFL